MYIVAQMFTCHLIRGGTFQKLGIKNNFELLNDSFLLEKLNTINKNIEFNRFTNSYINNKTNQLFADKSNILGVSLKVLIMQMHLYHLNIIPYC